MGDSKHESIPLEVKALRQDLDLWRETREKQGPLPEELWQRATELARRYGVTLIAQVMRLHHSKLKERVEATNEPPAEKGGSLTETAFVELSPATFSPDVGAQVVMELTGTDGSAMSLHLPAMNHLDVAGLVGAFFGRDR